MLFDLVLLQFTLRQLIYFLFFQSKTSLKFSILEHRYQSFIWSWSRHRNSSRSHWHGSWRHRHGGSWRHRHGSWSHRHLIDTRRFFNQRKDIIMPFSCLFCKIQGDVTRTQPIHPEPSVWDWPAHPSQWRCVFEQSNKKRGKFLWKSNT